ncbi:hypothetical protein M011DRAFT_431426 [Sporormia fimetaria CBS 119925]|uniref:Zn(2)-C6 fungal-type domain-containing protein n=1 Tax=Sporormia fimetaria CBS 119925 TaxID=1340428 RepID=A0A6A6V108_9PLEO|nr:hypothetical protein M011DRAFT_431426 [Sporormia fimetaria CBS 119925]
MEEIENPPGERSVQSRTTQACQRCRTLKTRCLPSDRSGVCQRCLHASRDCIWAEAPRKPRRGRGPSRISQVEQKIDGLVATLVNPVAVRTAPALSPPDESNENAAAAANQPPRKHAPGSWIPVAQSYEHQVAEVETNDELDNQLLEGIREIHSFPPSQPELNLPPGQIFNAHAPNESPIDNEELQRLVVSGEAEVLLNQYRNMAKSCPFVPISSGITARDLNASDPFLLLAILTVTSFRKPKQMRAFDKQYRTELANRTIIRPRRTVSLLQSLLVYLSWYHFVFSHKTQQIYTLVQLAVGLVHELGIYQEKNTAVLTVLRSTPRPPSAKQLKERQRAFLGCYYLSSAVSAGIMKPNLLRYSEYMGKCAQSLRNEPEYSSDRVISRLIGLRRIDDQVHDAFLAGEVAHLPITDSRIHYNLGMIESQLQDWNNDRDADDDNRTLDLTYAFTDMQLHLVGLRPIPPESLPYVQTSMQLSALVSILEAGKRYLDTLISFPASEYHLISFPEWQRLPHVVVNISRLCIPNESYAAVQWDAKAAQERVRLDLYLESLCYRMQSLTTFSFDKSKGTPLDFWQVMHMIMDLTRAWYCRKISGKKTATPAQQQTTPDNLPTPNTMPSCPGSINGAMDSNVLAQEPAGFEFQNSAMDTSGMEAQTRRDPLGFMRSPDFDMDAFLDLGLWGPESYHGMGFGGGFPEL